jgi:hypothetical protein
MIGHACEVDKERPAEHVLPDNRPSRGIPTATSGITVVRSEERDDPEQKQCRPACQLERSTALSHAIRCRCCSHPVSAENWPPHGTTFRPAGDVPSNPAVQPPKDLRTKDTERHRGFAFTPEADTRFLQLEQALLSGVGDSYSLFMSNAEACRMPPAILLVGTRSHLAQTLPSSTAWWLVACCQENMHQETASRAVSRTAEA